MSWKLALCQPHVDDSFGRGWACTAKQPNPHQGGPKIRRDAFRAWVSAAVDVCLGDGEKEKLLEGTGLSLQQMAQRPEDWYLWLDRAPAEPCIVADRGQPHETMEDGCACGFRNRRHALSEPLDQP